MVYTALVACMQVVWVACLVWWWGIFLFTRIVCIGRMESLGLV